MIRIPNISICAVKPSEIHLPRIFEQLEDSDAWMLKAATDYGIPIDNLKEAYSIDPLIKKSFDGTGRFISPLNEESYILTAFMANMGYFRTEVEVFYKTFDENTSLFGVTDSTQYSMPFAFYGGKITVASETIDSLLPEDKSLGQLHHLKLSSKKAEFISSGNVYEFIYTDDKNYLVGQPCLFSTARSSFYDIQPSNPNTKLAMLIATTPGFASVSAMLIPFKTQQGVNTVINLFNNKVLSVKGELIIE